MDLYTAIEEIVNIVTGLRKQSDRDSVAVDMIESPSLAEFDMLDAKRMYASQMYTQKMSQYIHSSLELDEFIDSVCDWEYNFIKENIL